MKLTLLIMVLVTGNLFSGDKFESLLKLNENKDYFKFIRNYDNAELGEWEKLYINALILNLKSKNKESNEMIIGLMEKFASSIDDSLNMQLLEIRMKNSVNMFNYKDAVYCTELIINNYSKLLDSNEADDMKNSLIIWKAAEDLKEQVVEITGDSKLNFKRDMAGLINISVKCGTEEENFVFDTGANFSVVNDTYAKKMKLVMLPGNIMVGSATGAKIGSKLAYAPMIEIGSMKFRNVLFLVMPDESLSFAGGLYVINGIIGLPVIKEMKELHIRENEIFVPKIKTKSTLGNLLIDGFITVIEVIDGNDSLAFTFDTGGKRTMLYSSYYNRYKTEIDKKYELEEIEFGGAGGTIKIKGFKLDSKLFKIGNSKLKLDDVRLLAENIKDHDKSFFGNLGQDYMSEFSEMILNFEDMYVDFKK